MSDLERICIDGYYVYCAHAEQIEELQVKLLDGLKANTIHTLKTEYHNCKVKFPIPLSGTISKNVFRMQRDLTFHQFPVNSANACTVYKLQGRSLKNLVISSWSYTENWIYVCLSRCLTTKGLFLRMMLDTCKVLPMSQELKKFFQIFRDTKQPNARVQLPRE